MKYWLMKSEPSVFGIDDLAAAPKRTSCWDGVRNYQVRNMLRDEFAVGDLAFFYHSSCEVPGIAGIVEVTKQGYPDHTAFDRKHPHHDPASTPDNPRWYMVDVRLKQRFSRVITLDELRVHAAGKLRDLLILRRGNRLSITPVDGAHWKFINSLV
ncbi:MAG: EVE domain-containing protein [Gammaproteobacteria bacterium]|jgi:predicted RNA-binding protein with PUA-like domain|nr:EVE domain-containing protein [Gammaproteobacteria bacterium]